MQYRICLRTHRSNKFHCVNCSLVPRDLLTINIVVKKNSKQVAWSFKLMKTTSNKKENRK